MILIFNCLLIISYEASIGVLTTNYIVIIMKLILFVLALFSAGRATGWV